MTDLRVLHISDSESEGGAEAVFRATVEASEKLGHTVETFVAAGERNPFSYVFSMRSYKDLRSKLTEFRPNVIHLHNYYHFLSPSVLSAIAGYRRTGRSVKVVFTAHDFHVICPNSGLQRFSRGQRINYDPLRVRARFWHRLDERSWLHSSLKLLQHMLAYQVLGLSRVLDVLIAPSSFMASALRANLANEVVVLSNPVHLSAQPSAQAEDESRSGIAFVGRLAPEKGLREFLLQVEALGVKETLDVYGDGPERQSLQELADSFRHLSVAFHGRLPSVELQRRLTQKKVLAFPSRWAENAPLAILEAASAGLQIVAPKQGGVLSMSEKIARADLYDLDDSQTLLGALSAALAAERPNRVLNPSEFSVEHYGRGIEEIYALDRARSPRGDAS